MPRSAPMPEPTISAVGVARPSAHGQAMTSTAMAARIASTGVAASGFTQGRKVAPQSSIGRRASGNSAQATRLARAMASTAGTKRPVMRSANSWIGTREP